MTEELPTTMQHAPGRAVKIQMFGRFGIWIDGVPVDGLHRREGKRLLAYLVLHAGEPVKYRTLASLFWPFEANATLEGSSTFQSTRQAVRSLRVALGDQAPRLASTGRGILCLNLEGVECDMLRFDAAATSNAPEKWQKAIALQPAPLLEGWTDTWAQEARRRRLRSVDRLTNQLDQSPDQSNDSATEPTITPSVPEYSQVLPAHPHKLSPMLVRQTIVGGAMPPDAPGYIEREADKVFARAVSSGDSTILVKGPLQSGKSSLLARGLEHAREIGDRVVLTDFQALNETQMASPGGLFLALIINLSLELGIEFDMTQHWHPYFGAGLNLELFIKRYVLSATEDRFVWGMDDVDRIFHTPYCNEFFGLLRSWHNRRALDPDGPWQRMTIALTYATEATVFISDVNQSPFNVGTMATIAPLSHHQAAGINRLYGSPLRSDEEVGILNEYVGGQPYLVRCGLEMLADGKCDIDTLLHSNDYENGAFSRHLKRIRKGLSDFPELAIAISEVLQGVPVHSRMVFSRLHTKGVLDGEWRSDQRFRCELYHQYLKWLSETGELNAEG